MERFTRLLYALAAVLLGIGLTLRALPTPAAEARRAPAPASDGGVTVPQSPDERPADSAVIARGNVFSASRSAPRERYVPPDLAPVPDQPATGRKGPLPTRLKLFGTVVGPAGTAALIDADPAVRGAEIYQVGDVVEGRRIVAVSESTVVLEGTAGRMVLRLPPNPQPSQ